MADQLQGIDCANKRIILHIISGNGFALLKGSIVVNATLMNHKLQSKIIPVQYSNQLKFASEIIWSIDNASLKQLKMSHASIRIECFHLPPHASNSNVRLGYILLKLKEVQTFDPTLSNHIETTSYKLVGSKNGNFTLTISLCIEDSSIKNVENLTKRKKNLKSTNNKINDNENHLQRIGENKHFGENIEMHLPKIDDNIISKQVQDMVDSIESQNSISFNMQEKKKEKIEELENWKNKQMILFDEKLKIKEEQLFKEFNNKWLEDRNRIEEELGQAVSTCKVLTENVDKMADTLMEREAIIKTKELELTCQKESIDNKYISLMQKMQSSNTQTVNQLKQKNIELETRLHYLEETNTLLKNENKQLKDNINSSCGLRVQQLEKNISNLEKKYEEANNSCMFFKERWIASVRKMNQMYTKFHGTNTNEFLINNKQKIQNILTNNLEERKEDEEKLKILLNDLRKLRLDMTNSNYLGS